MTLRAWLPFKGNVDLKNLEKFLKEKSVALFIMTITNNSAGGQPVSMENLKAATALCKKYKTPMVLDACRFAENSWFIKIREKGYSNKSPLEIAKETFSLADVAFVSAKKDGMANSGGFLSLTDSELSVEFKNRLIPSEGFPSYGGLAGRDLETIAEGLSEALDESYLHYRIASVKYLHDKLKKAGVFRCQSSRRSWGFYRCKKNPASYSRLRLSRPGPSSGFLRIFRCQRM